MENTNTSASFSIIKGGNHQDERGLLVYNNEFEFANIKRFYKVSPVGERLRGWQGHKIEQRWFAVIKGKFKISVIEIVNFENPSKDLLIQQYILNDESLTYLHVPAGCITAIQALEENSKLLALADYGLGETQDEIRYPLEFFDRK